MKKIHKSIKRRLWVIVVVSMNLLVLYVHAQDIDQVQVYDVPTNQTVYFGEAFEFDSINNILEEITTTYGIAGTTTFDKIIANLKQKPKDLRCFEM